MDNCFNVLRDEYKKEYKVLILTPGNNEVIAHHFATVRACNKAYSVHRMHQTTNGYLWDYDDFKVECFSITSTI
jgi:hypothetical protein